MPAGDTLADQPVDSDPNVIHVDTGGGKFDHHQDQKRKPACFQVLSELKKQSLKVSENEALERLIAVVTDADEGNYIHWPESQTDRYEFSLDSLIGGLKKLGYPDEKVVELACILLDGVYSTLRSKIRAEKILDEGIVFKTPWGKGIGFEADSDAVLDLGEKKGFSVVVRRDPHNGSVRIYARNDRGVDLTPVLEKLKKMDSEATWFLHQSKCLLLNGSSKNPNMRITKLSFKEVLEAFKEN